jgi:von Willebrand factor type A domain
MALQPHHSSSDDNTYSFAPAGASAPSPPAQPLDALSRPTTSNPHPQATVSTLEVNPLHASSGLTPSLTPPVATLSTASIAMVPPPVSQPTPESPVPPVSTPGPSPATAQAEPSGSAPPAAGQRPAKPPGSKLRPKRRRGKVRLLYLMQAWSVSLVVHIVILSALAAATFTSTDALKKMINIDSALVANRSSETELTPIYADPSNDPRDKAIGDENANDPKEPVLANSDDSSESDDGGGMIVASVGGRPTATPKVRGAGKGKINEGNSLPNVKIDGLGSSPLSLLPIAPAVDLGGGGKISGDPVFDVKDIGTALDQLAREILRHLKDHKLTVVWLFDESVSQQDDQKAILQKFDRVSSELKINVDTSKKAAGALNHAVVGFGEKMDYVIEKPREDIDQIGQAIKRLRVDSTGIENTMHAIVDVVDHYSSLIRKDRQVLIVLVTDESGDDGADIEEARLALKKYKVPLYVVGRQSLFGYPFAHHRYVDPVTKDIYYPLIRRGPETADVELYQWDGLYDRWDERPSGFAPYELARLTKDSGGIYFILPSEEFMRIRQRETAYSITQLKEYLPEYDNRMIYAEKRNSSPLRQTIHAVVSEGKNYLYRREFPIESQELTKLAFEEGSKATLKLNALLAIQDRLEKLAKVREREPEKRWQAHYDLMLAQTVAFQVKAYEYRALMASIVNSPPVPKGRAAGDSVITWVVNHSTKPLAPKNETGKKYAEAERLLKNVIAKHPKTPWGDLAQDILTTGFSVKLDEWHHHPKFYERQQFVPKY